MKTYNVAVTNKNSGGLPLLADFKKLKVLYLIGYWPGARIENSKGGK